MYVGTARLDTVSEQYQKWDTYFWIFLFYCFYLISLLRLAGNQYTSYAVVKQNNMDAVIK